MVDIGEGFIGALYKLCNIRRMYWHMCPAYADNAICAALAYQEQVANAVCCNVTQEGKIWLYMEFMDSCISCSEEHTWIFLYIVYLQGLSLLPEYMGK